MSCLCKWHDFPDKSDKTCFHEWSGCSMLTLCASGLFSTVSLFLLVTHATHSSCTANPHRLTFPWPQDARQTHVESTLLLLRGHVTSPTPTFYLCLEVRCILHLTVNINSKWTTTLKIVIRCGKNTNFFFFWKLSISLFLVLSCESASLIDCCEKLSYKGLTVKKGRKLISYALSYFVWSHWWSNALTDNFTCGFKGSVDLNTSPAQLKELLKWHLNKWWLLAGNSQVSIQG